MWIVILSVIAAILALFKEFLGFLKRGFGLDKKPNANAADHDLTSWIGRPASIGKAFLGRKTPMKDLKKVLKKRRVLVLSGGAGTGKSRLAAEYTHSFGARGFWTAAGDNVDRTLAALAPSLGILIEGRSDEEVAGEREVKLALRKTLFKYRLHQDQELFDRVCGYIREYY